MAGRPDGVDLSPGDGELRCSCGGPMFTCPGWGEYYRCERCGEESPREGTVGK